MCLCAAGTASLEFLGVACDLPLLVCLSRLGLLLSLLLYTSGCKRDPEVLKVVIGRLGDAGRETERVVEELIRSGCARLPNGFDVRLIAFGAFPPGAPVPPCRIISLGHVLDFLQSYVHKHWKVLRHLQFKDPALGFLMTMEKARRGHAGRRGEEGVEIVASPQPRRRQHQSETPVHRRRQR